MEGIGGYIWLVGLGGGLVALTLAYIYATTRRQKPGGDPNHAWKQAAAEAGAPEVARQTPERKPPDSP